MNSKMTYCIALFLLFGALFFQIARWAKPYIEERLPDEFTIEKLAMDVKGDFPTYPLPDLTDLAKQPFYYLGHGGQSVAFRSEDDRYVLKFFLIRNLHGKKRYPMPKPTHWIPSHRKKRHARRDAIYQKCLFNALNNYKTAYEKLKNKTGILSMHLAATEEDLPFIQLYDAQQKEHWIDLNRASFILQEKALLVKEKLSTLSSEEKTHALNRLEDFFEARAKAGFIDIEKSFMIEANYGFLGDTPIQLDVGNIEYFEQVQAAPQDEIARMQNLLRNWANENVY